jgi:large subunit ribosomal protein L30
MSDKKLKVTLVKSTIGILPRHKHCVKGLGLRKTNHSVEVENTPSVRGMINKVNYLLKVEG